MTNIPSKNKLNRILSLICVLALLVSLSSCEKAGNTAQNNTAWGNAAGSGNVIENASFGSPWVDSCLAENLPEKAPEAKDDLYLHFNRDLLEEHAGELYLEANANDSVIQDYVQSVILTSPGQGLADGAYSEAELAQLRIFYHQAEDLEALAAAGISRIQQYLDMVEKASTLEELNKVLVSEDFPFSPYIEFVVSAYDMYGKNNVFIYPQLLFVDNQGGAKYYQDTDDPQVQDTNLNMIYQTAAYVMQDLTWLGLDYDQIEAAVSSMVDLESSYGKYAGYGERYQGMPFGAVAESNTNMSLDELAQLCPNYPVKETVVKLGKDASEFFTVWEKDWLKSFNAVWTEDNLELLKLLTKAKIIHECEPYLDPSVYDPARAIMGQDAQTAQANTIDVCNRSFIFGQLFGKIYVADCFSESEIARLNDLTSSLASAFKKMIEDTEWVSSSSKEKLLQKLDEMRLNIMQPDGGYLDFSSLELVPSEEGGSLLDNYFRIKAWFNQQDNSLLGKDALAQYVWNSELPTDFGCFYENDTNSINITPGFVAGLGSIENMSDEKLMGTVGWMTAHEMGHAFDYFGAQFDARGRGELVLEEADVEAYLAMVDRLAAYFDSFEALPGVHFSGQNVKTEAAADITGMQVALKAAENIAGFDYDEFFGSAAEYMFMVLPSSEYVEFFLTDEHPLHYIRVNASAQMTREFYDTYGVSEGDGMYLPEDQRSCFWGK